MKHRPYIMPSREIVLSARWEQYALEDLFKIGKGNFV
jgi:hypothetical protein